jgi:hypothetical protein
VERTGRPEVKGNITRRTRCLALALVCCTGCAAGCAARCRPAPDSPRGVLLKVINMVQSGDWREMRNCVTPDLYLLMQNLQSDLAVAEYTAHKQRKIVETINNDAAYVSVFFKGVEQPVTFYFRRINGSWLIDMPFARPDGGIGLQEIVPYIEDGDFILSREDHLSSYYIRSLAKIDQRFSHSGIIYRKNGKLSVICADGVDDQKNNKKSGVVEIQLDDFIKNKSAVGIFRFKKRSRALFSDKALEYLGVPFNFEYDINDEKSFYCTQLIQVVLRETHTPVQLPLTYIEKEKKDILMLDSISGSDNFEEILYYEKER